MAQVRTAHIELVWYVNNMDYSHYLYINLLNIRNIPSHNAKARTFLDAIN